MGLLDWFRKPTPAVQLAQLCYDVAYFILPHDAFKDLTKLTELCLNTPQPLVGSSTSWPPKRERSSLTSRTQNGSGGIMGNSGAVITSCWSTLLRHRSICPMRPLSS